MRALAPVDPWPAAVCISACTTHTYAGIHTRMHQRVCRHTYAYASARAPHTRRQAYIRVCISAYAGIHARMHQRVHHTRARALSPYRQRVHHTRIGSLNIHLTCSILRACDVCMASTCMHTVGRIRMQHAACILTHMRMQHAYSRAAYMQTHVGQLAIHRTLANGHTHNLRRRKHLDVSLCRLRLQ